MRIFIIPMEPLLFRRTGRSFTAGESGYADSWFPPTPETLQGAIRAAIASHWDSTMTDVEVFQDKDFINLVGTRTEYGHFRITSIALGRWYRGNKTFERLFPAPAYIQKHKGDIFRLQLEPESGVQTNVPESMVQDRMRYLSFESNDKLKSVDWLTAEGLRKALTPKEVPNEEETVSNEEIFTYEPRLGIAINNETKATREGFLYQMRMVRMNHDVSNEYLYGFVVDIRLAKPSNGVRGHEQMEDDSRTRELLHLTVDDGWITLGGERRAARFEVLEGSEPDDLEQTKKGSLLYLATPAAFNDGWKPKDWRPHDWHQPLPPPIAAAIERYQPIGGWLLVPGSTGGNDKPIRRCVPAGSVYFFDQSVMLEGPFTNHGWQIGYGIAYAGEW